MRSPSIILYASLLLAIPGSAQQPKPAPDANAPASVQGVVLNRYDNVAIPQVAVRLAGEDGAPEHQYETDSDTEGRFRFTGVAPGRYRLTTERAGYLPLYGSRSQASGMFIGVAPAAELHLMARMMAAAVIKGNVVDLRGQPMSQSTVQVLEEMTVNGRRRTRAAGRAVTDDHGEFRVHSLPPGRYYIVAMRARTRENLQAASAQEEKSTYVPTYYPSEIERPMAIPVDVRSGEEAPLQIMLRRAETVIVRGKVLVMGNVLARGGSVEFSQAGVPLDTPSATATVRPDGTFETRLTPASYRAVASVSGPGGNASGRQSVRIGREGTPDLVITIGAATRLTASVYVRSRAYFNYATSSPTLSLLPLLDDEDVDVPSSPIVGAVDRASSRSLVFDNVPAGRYEVIAGGRGGLFLDSFVESIGGGRSDDSIELRGESRATATIILNLDGAQVAGKVYTPKGSPLAGAVVVAVPDSPRRDHTSLYRTASTDQEGSFTLHGLPPGNYVVIAWDEVEDQAWLDPGFLGSAESSGVKISVRERDRQQIPLKAIITVPQLLEAGQ